MGRTVAPTAVAWLLLAAVACTGAPSPGGKMLSLPPPPGWESDLLEFRAARDDFFRRGQESPLLPEEIPGFDGLDYWQPDPRYYFAGPLRPYAEPERLMMITTAGKQRECEKVGWLEFELDGHPLTLQVYRLLDNPAREGGAGLFLPFMDATTGAETYPAGRYINLLGPTGGPFVLDFNRAYNPSCAYGAPERFACPVTPPENRLPVRVEAGERGFRDEG